MLAWPPFLPAPTRDGWDAVLPDGVARTPMDQGPEKTRGDATTSGGAEQFVAEWKPADFEDFLDFYEDAKAERFSFPHWFWGPSEAIFAGPPSVSRNQTKFVVRFELKVYVTRPV